MQVLIVFSLRATIYRCRFQTAFVGWETSQRCGSRVSWHHHELSAGSLRKYPASAVCHSIKLFSLTRWRRSPIVVCTLCSCFPTQLLGRPPLWYKERSYRARTVLEPRKVLAEFGCQLAAGQKVRVVDSTSECRYMVLPARPTGTDDWTAERLAAIVTRDSLIGVRNIAPPQQ